MCSKIFYHLFCNCFFVSYNHILNIKCKISLWKRLDARSPNDPLKLWSVLPTDPHIYLKNNVFVRPFNYKIFTWSWLLFMKNSLSSCIYVTKPVFLWEICHKIMYNINPCEIVATSSQLVVLVWFWVESVNWLTMITPNKICN